MTTCDPVVTLATFRTKLSDRIAMTETRRSSSWIVPGARTVDLIARSAAGSDFTPVRWIFPGDSLTEPSSLSSPS